MPARHRRYLASMSRRHRASSTRHFPRYFSATPYRAGASARRRRTAETDYQWLTPYGIFADAEPSMTKRFMPVSAMRCDLARAADYEARALSARITRPARMSYAMRKRIATARRRSAAAIHVAKPLHWPPVASGSFGFRMRFDLRMSVIDAISFDYRAMLLIVKAERSAYFHHAPCHWQAGLRTGLYRDEASPRLMRRRALTRDAHLPQDWAIRARPLATTARCVCEQVPFPTTARY